MSDREDLPNFSAHQAGLLALTIKFADALCLKGGLTGEQSAWCVELNQYLDLPSRLRRWTSAEDAKLLELDNMMAPEAAKVMGRSPWAIRSRRRNLRARGKLPKTA